MRYFAVNRDVAFCVMTKREGNAFFSPLETRIGENEIAYYMTRAKYGELSKLMLFEHKEDAMVAAEYLAQNKTVYTKMPDEHGVDVRIVEEVARVPSIYLQFNPVVEVSVNDQSCLQRYYSGLFMRQFFDSPHHNIEAIYSYTYKTGSFDNPEEVCVVKEILAPELHEMSLSFAPDSSESDVSELESNPDEPNASTCILS